MKKISIEISDNLYDGLERESAISSTSIDQLVAQKLDDTINQGDFAMDVKGALSSLRDYLLKIPSIKDTSISEDTGSSWIIESDLPYLDPKYIMSHLEAKLPGPVGDINEWLE